jgi:dihydropteroate synthase
MGIVNVTNDSFSDGGRFLDRDRAVAHGLALVARGAQIVDVGGESTRPGATRLNSGVERERVLPVIKELAAQGVTVSIDTMHAEVAEAALDCGARPHHIPAYGDVVDDVRAELLTAVDAAVAAGVSAENLIIDPGLGFAKSAQHNWALLRALPQFVATGIPVLVGASRKRFLGALLAEPDGTLREPDGRETATAVISALAAEHGAWGVRVHDVRASADAVRVAQAWTSGGSEDIDG